LEDHPVIAIMNVFEPPAFLTNRPYGTGVQVIGCRVIKWGPDPETIAKKYGAEKVTLSEETKPAEFARMLAKIAYAYAAAELGFDKFREVFVRDIIMGRSSDIGRWVGGSSEDLDTPPQAIHYLAVQKTPNGQDPAAPALITVRLKLFASSPTPTYTVVIGTASV
jgi:hypothetical protein